uniref:saccharopine dehydrogenase NADP-binding domain-containing protein n=1 Tax=Nonomuraea rhizosphaerae TaxID=2665663 RepID=UPI001C5DE206
MKAPLIAIYGANGHTGRLVASGLLSRGHEIVLAGRDESRLRAFAEELGKPERVRTHVAALDDPAALRSLAESAAVLIHCAGPFAETCEPVAAACAAGGCHYLDHAVEPHPVKYLFDSMQAAAERAGIVMVPQMSFYGGVADLLAAAVADGLPG